MKKVFILMVAACVSVMAAATQYQKVTAVGQLADGDVVVMANETAGKISSSLYSTNKYITAMDATFANGTATAEGATEITLTASGSNWKLKVGSKTIGNNNNVDLNGEGKGSTTYSISFDADGNAVIANTVASNGTFFFNAGSPRFKTYTSTTMAKIQLYKKLSTPTDTVPTVVPDTTAKDTVTPPVAQGEMVTYKLLQSTEHLQAGDKVFFGTPAKDFVLGQYVSGSNIKGVAATYSENRHEVTANDLYAYTVSIEDGKYVFTGTDGKYLYMYNTNKNLSSSETLDNKAKWTLSIADDVATIKSVYSSAWGVYFNKTAATPLFCCYNSSPAYDNNIASVVLYSNNAPDYQEKVLHPALEVLHDGAAVGDTLDWGYVVYDDSWGTEAAPYAGAMSLSVVGTDLTDSIYVSLQTGSHFMVYTEQMAPRGGSLTVNFETTAPGEYSDVLTIRCGDLVQTIALHAVATRQAPSDEDAPTLTVSVSEVNFVMDLQGNDAQEVTFYVSAENLAKTLYLEWQKTLEEPTIGYGEIEMDVEGWGSIQAGEKAQLAAPTVDNAAVTIAVYAYGEFAYETALHFTSYKAGSKTELAIDYQLPLSITVTSLPTGMKDVQVQLGGRTYNLLGQEVDSSYHGLVVRDGVKVVQ